METYLCFRKAPFLIVFLLWSNVSKSQTISSDTTTINRASGVVFECFIPENPEFPGGDKALSKYLTAHLQYPKAAIDAKIEGKVFTAFVVTKEGRLEDVKVMKGLGYGLDEEALRVIHGMPRWKPGRMREEPTSVKYNLPITFNLEDLPKTK